MSWVWGIHHRADVSGWVESHCHSFGFQKPAERVHSANYQIFLYKRSFSFVSVCVFWACVRKWIQCKWSIFCLILYFCLSVTFSPATLFLQVKQCINPVDLIVMQSLWVLLELWSTLPFKLDWTLSWVGFFFFFTKQNKAVHFSKILCEVKTVKF